MPKSEVKGRYKHLGESGQVGARIGADCKTEKEKALKNNTNTE